MKPLKLSRSSKLYGFVFGRNKGWFVDGFPEPRGDTISAGLFGALFLAATIIRAVSAITISVFVVLFWVLGFLIDGSYVHGNILRGDARIKKIEPWPTWYGRRLPPYFIFVVVGIWLMYLYVGIKDAVEFLLASVFAGVVFYFIDPNDKSPSEQFAEKVGPEIDRKLSLAYYRGSNLFPSIQLVD